MSKLEGEGGDFTRPPIPGGWAERDVSVGERLFNMLVPANPEAFLREGSCGASAVTRDPYWAELWPTALSMAEFVLRHDWTPGTPALELGCGSGLVGLAGLAAGLEVTFSDYVPLAVDLAVENARRNGFQKTGGITLDWRRPPSKQQFPIVVASDVLYDRDLHEPLLNALDAVLSPDGVCWMGEPGRSIGDEFVALVADTSCWAVHNVDGSQTTDCGARLLSLTKC